MIQQNPSPEEYLCIDVANMSSSVAKKFNKDKIIDVLDIRGSSKKDNWLQNYLRDLSSASSAKQVAVGGVSGWLAGFLCCKVGKIAAVSIGGSLLLLQIASHQGYVQVNWNKVNRHMEQAKREIEKNAQKKLPRLMEETQRFVQENVILASGFAGGFLLGVASS